MKLTYRGISYDYTPNPVPKLGPEFATGTYRGAPVSFRAIADVPEQPSFELTWRGASYHSGSKVSGSRVNQPEPVVEPSVATPAGAGSKPTVWNKDTHREKAAQESHRPYV